MKEKRAIKATLSDTVEQRILKTYVLRHQNGARIPTEKELSSTYGVSVTTVRRAVSLLEQKGKVIRRHGSGTFVADGKVNYSVAILVPEMAYGDFYQQLAFSLEPNLRTYGIDCHIYVSNTPGFQINELRASLRQHDAIILCGYGATDEDMDSIGKPYLVVGCETSTEAPYVGFDMLSIMRQTVNHLVNTGCKKIRVLTHSLPATNGNGKSYDMNMRIFSFFLSLQQLKLPFSDNQIVSMGLTVSDYRAKLEKLLQDDSFDALICSNDIIAITACQVLMEHGINIPRDVSIVGGNNIIPVAQQQIPISTVDFCFNELAIHASKMLDAILLHRETGQIASCFIRPKLVLRDTTRPLQGK